MSSEGKADQPSKMTLNEIYIESVLVPRVRNPTIVIYVIKILHWGMQLALAWNDVFCHYINYSLYKFYQHYSEVFSVVTFHQKGPANVLSASLLIKHCNYAFPK